MKSDSMHIKQIKVISNTHWDREFRLSFEKTRRRLLDMMDITLDILDDNSDYKSYTMDAHSIMIEDYLQMRPERREQIERLIRANRLIIGPYYTLPEMLNISAESITRNLLLGRKIMEEFGAAKTTVAYTPTSWGQTGQLPQIMANFGLNKIMFYRGISHHESDAEFIWEAPDGTKALGSRFAVFARYNWYYLVHRMATEGCCFEKTYQWGRSDEIPFRLADGTGGEDLIFEFIAPEVKYDKSYLKNAIQNMINIEGPHCTTEVFLAMDGHDISAAYPKTPQMIVDANEIFKGKYSFEHTDMENYWAQVEKHLDINHLPVLKGERRSYLKEGKWTFLLPGSISARTYLKQKDFNSSVAMERYAEPMACLAAAFSGDYPRNYLDRGWKILLSNHTHDANGGCAPDVVCQDMEYRYRQVMDIADIVTKDSMMHIAKNLSPSGLSKDTVQLIVYNPLPFERDAVALVDIEIGSDKKAQSVNLVSENDKNMERQPISNEKSSSFMDSIWDVPKIFFGNRLRFYARFKKLPALGYRTYIIAPELHELRNPKTMITGPNSMENEYLKVVVNSNGTVDISDKKTGKEFNGLNYLTDQGECGSAWAHATPAYDRKYNTLGVNARVSVIESGPLVGVIAAEYNFAVPVDYADGQSRSETLVELPVNIKYRLEKGCEYLKVEFFVDNHAKDHWLRVNFPTLLNTDMTWADSHYDVVGRNIEIPDSTGWVEKAGGTHPLRTFVDMTNGKNGLAIMPKGLIEYEAFEDVQSTLALTIIRACRIKLAVSEEKKTELSDIGQQCRGKQCFEYAILPHSGNWEHAELFRKAVEYITPIKVALAGRGKGTLPLEQSLFSIDNNNVHVTCIKQAQDGSDLIVRVFNPCLKPQKAALVFRVKIQEVKICLMDESEKQNVSTTGDAVNLNINPKKIMTLKIKL